MKRTIKAASLILALTMILCACGEKPQPVENPNQTVEQPQTQTEAQTQTAPAPEKKDEQPEQKQGYEPQEPLLYAWCNPITLNDHTEEDSEYFAKYGNNRYMSYVTVSGLKDTSVENAINGAVLGVFNKADQWKLPPYRGTGKIDPSWYEGAYGSFDLYSTFNSNDYLCLFGYQSMGMLDGNAMVYCDDYAMTFDLRTGKQLQLGDLFADGYPYEDVINAAVSAYLSKNDADSETVYLSDDDFYYEDYMSSVSLVSPFKGINEDQKYYLSDSGLYIILDYNNKELDFSGNYVEPAVVSLNYSDFGDGLLLSRECDPSIYTAAVSGSKHPVANNNNSVYEVNDLYKGEYQIDYRETINYPKGTSEDLLEIVRNMLKIERVSTEPYERMARIAKEDTYVSYWFETTASIMSYGEYYVVHYYVGIPPVDYDSGTYYTKEETVVYDKDLNVLKPSDIFAGGFDWVGFLADKFRESVEEERNYGYVCQYEPDYRAIAENCKYGLQIDCIWFSTNDSVTLENMTGDYSFQFCPYLYINYDSDEFMLFDL